METTASALAELRRESHSIFNRIHSIGEDAAFVKQVHDHYPDLPLLPNMRCGAWYTDPKIASAERAYFKSTDGHTNNWSFNLRRPNLHVLPLITKYAGQVFHSKGAGKRIPDALSKTVPIWCSVVNRAILKRATETNLGAWDIALYTPPGSVSPQEHSQIEGRLDAWAFQLAASSYSLPELDHPLRPMWITPATTVFPAFPKPPDRVFYPIVCVSASKQVTDGMERRASGFAYIQGSGDDHELWGMGLTPALYWRHYSEILTTGSLDLPGLIRSLVATPTRTGDTIVFSQSLCGTPIERVAGRISICNIATLQRPDLLQAHLDTAFLCLTPDHPSCFIGAVGALEDDPRVLVIQTPDGKKGQNHLLAVVLPRSMPFIQTHLRNLRDVCVACNTGTDVAVGVAVAALARFFQSDGSLCPQGNGRGELSKHMLRSRLEWIISSCPSANPSRTTLKRINDFLLSPISNPLMLGTSNCPEGVPDLDKQEDLVDDWRVSPVYKSQGMISCSGDVAKAQKAI